MKAIQCQLCGSNALTKQGDHFICDLCGTKHSAEEVRKLMIAFDGPFEVKGTVEIRKA